MVWRGMRDRSRGWLLLDTGRRQRGRGRQVLRLDAGRDPGCRIPPARAEVGEWPIVLLGSSTLRFSGARLFAHPTASVLLATFLDLEEKGWRIYYTGLGTDMGSHPEYCLPDFDNQQIGCDPI
jgi:hypothetical protein